MQLVPGKSGICSGALNDIIGDKQPSFVVQPLFVERYTQQVGMRGGII